MSKFLESSNPALKSDAFNPFAYQEGATAADVRTNTMTLQGVVNKTGLFVLLATAAGAAGYGVANAMPSIVWISAIAAFLIGLGIYFVLVGNPKLAMTLGPVYAVVEGFFLGAFTSLADNLLLSQGIAVAGGVATQAFMITISVLLVMLVLYSTRIIKPTQKLISMVCAATGAIMLLYMVSFVMSMFGGSLPLIGMSSVFNTGTAGYIGLGINLFILAIASLWLVIDFGMIEEKIQAGAPKQMEWFCGFALLVTLAWIYFEAVKIVMRVAVLFSGRD